MIFDRCEAKNSRLPSWMASRVSRVASHSVSVKPAIAMVASAAIVGEKRDGSDDNQVGYDAGKQVKGRKIHALVDSEGPPMSVVVHSAAIQDRGGAGLVLDKIRRRFPWLELIWADGGHNAWQVGAPVATVPPLRMEIIKRSDDMKGFVCRAARQLTKPPICIARW
jgi:hypothetical protein